MQSKTAVLENLIYETKFHDHCCHFSKYGVRKACYLHFLQYFESHHEAAFRAKCKWCATEDSVNLSNKILDLLDCNITENVAINCKNVQQG